MYVLRPYEYYSSDFGGQSSDDQQGCQRSAEVRDDRGGVEEFVGSIRIQCDIRTEELPPQHAEVIYYDSGYVE